MVRRSQKCVPYPTFDCRASWRCKEEDQNAFNSPQEQGQVLDEKRKTNENLGHECSEHSQSSESARISRRDHLVAKVGCRKNENRQTHKRFSDARP